jgi:hypothetical protein
MDAGLPMVLPCYFERDVEKSVRSSNNEDPIARGVTLAGEAFTIFANKKTGSFTILIVTPGKATCILSAGTDFEELIQGDDL